MSDPKWLEEDKRVVGDLLWVHGKLRDDEKYQHFNLLAAAIKRAHAYIDELLEVATRLEELVAYEGIHEEDCETKRGNFCSCVCRKALSLLDRQEPQPVVGEPVLRGVCEEIVEFFPCAVAGIPHRALPYPVE